MAPGETARKTELQNLMSATCQGKHILAKHIIAKSSLRVRARVYVCVCEYTRYAHMCVTHVRLHGRGRTTKLQNGCSTAIPLTIKSVLMNIHSTFASST